MCCQDRPLAMTVPQVAALLDMSPRAVYRAVEAGVIPCVRIGRRILIPTAPLYRKFGIDDEHDRADEQASDRPGDPEEPQDDEAA